MPVLRYLTVAISVPLSLVAMLMAYTLIAGWQGAVAPVICFALVVGSAIAAIHFVSSKVNKRFQKVLKQLAVAEERISSSESSASDLSAEISALGKSQAIIEFDVDGNILTANDNFLKAMGYRLDEIVGRHHAMFVEPTYGASAEYKQFWASLRRGEYQSAEFKRFNSRGEEVWIQASYNPICDDKGNVVKIVKYATDITEQKKKNADIAGKIDAINKALAVIEFDLEGNILNANENFLNALGYSLEEVQGAHHRQFVSSEYARSSEYAAFWESLKKGHYNAGEYLRYKKSGEEIWIQASYNPIFDQDGKPVKVVKYASDITESKRFSIDATGKIAAIGKSQAVIEFEPNGTIITANENFLAVTGYRLEEVQGKHHKMFVDPEYAASHDYRAFWESLEHGEYQSNKYKRIKKDGDEIWIQASYNPIVDESGNTVKVVKFATDITQVQCDTRTALFKSIAFDGSSVAMMMVDRDFIVTHINESTKALLGKNEAVFKEIWPSFTASNIVGSCIDMFHKNPAHQRQLLSDPSRLPYRTDITVGDFKFALNVSAVLDEKGDYVGNILEWDDVTDDRLNAGILSSLDRSQAIIEFSLDGHVLKANKNFLDVMGYTLDEIVGQHHRVFVDKEYASSDQYRYFWDSLAKGEHHEDKYQRVAKGGKQVWIQGVYSPILDGNGNPFKVVKFVTDITDIENTRIKNERETKERAEQLAIVIKNLADGLNALSTGNFDSQIHTVFSEEYEQLRSDFNTAVDKLQRAEEGRIDAEKKQAFVVENLASALNDLSEGKLTKSIDDEFSEEYEQLRTDYNNTVATLKDVMEAIVSTARGIRHGATEISRSADDLSRRTENQASTLEETAAALDEITATVKQTAEGANAANSAASNARKEAQENGEVVLQAVEAMGEIEKSSGQISQIISVIDDIAFQTNLLALNAGVEAARAGDAGRGFAVVAQEVRALAQRSSDAAKEIKGLISSSSQHVDKGVELVGKAGQALQDIVGRVENVSDLVSEIAASAREQSASLSEVNTAVNKMDQVTQQNAAMVEQTTAASHSLTSDADELMGKVSHFDIGEDRRGNVAADRRQEKRNDYKTPEQPASLMDQQEKVRTYAAASGGAALKIEQEDDDWEEF